tara:strand:- start:573 stop:956 length:384 start_codon:yes stop_codon:yes gene_type:complete
MIYFLKIVFYISLAALILLSLFPGSLLGLFFYGDLGQQPNLIKNPYGTTINHFISYLYVSILGLFVYSKTKKFNSVVFQMFFLSTILEILQFFVPNRAFQLGDLIGNFLGVLVAYFLIKIYLFIVKP